MERYLRPRCLWFGCPVRRRTVCRGRLGSSRLHRNGSFRGERGGAGGGGDEDDYAASEIASNLIHRLFGRGIIRVIVP